MMPQIRHSKRPPEIQLLLAILARYSIRYVVTGSVAALLYGVELEPADLDITPQLDHQNLERLILVLTEIEATPAAFGHWETKLDGEKKWVEEDTTPQALASWTSTPNDLSSLDHLFQTRYGNFDVVPQLAGDYETLMKSAVRKAAFGHQIRIAHIDEVLAKLTVPRRKKDIPRVQQLRKIQRLQRLALLQPLSKNHDGDQQRYG
jgi:hypothetical protein